MSTRAVPCHTVICDGCGGALATDDDVIVHFPDPDDPAITAVATEQGWAVLSGGRHRCAGCR